MQSCCSHIQPELLLKEIITLAHPFIHVIPHFASLQCLPSLYWLCTHFPFIFKSFIPILSCFHLAFICHFSPLPDKEFWFHYFFFFYKPCFAFPTHHCFSQIHPKERYSRIATATSCCWCAVPTPIMLLLYLVFLPVSSCLVLHFSSNFFSTDTFFLLYVRLVVDTTVPKIRHS